jgi:hypothetical protein
MASRSRSNARNRSADTPPQSTARSTSERKSSTYDPNFEQILIDHGTYPEEYDYSDENIPPTPNNWDDIMQRLAQPRSSLSPSRFSREDFRKFKRINAQALSEKKVMSSVFPIVRGDANIPYEEDKLFGNLEPFADGITDAKPDFYDGARAGQLDKRVRSDLSHYIVPSTQNHAPILPNFFAEGKGPDGSAAVAKRQALYDGTLGARAMHRIQSYGNALAYDNNAYTIASTYHDGQLKLYTNHPTPSIDPERSTDYYMNQLGAWALAGNPETFRHGATAFRNARDWAKEQRDRFIMAANETVRDMPLDISFEASSGTLHSRSTPVAHSRDSETSTDELAAPDITKLERKPRLKRALSRTRREWSDSRSKSSRRSHSTNSSQRN